MSIEMRIADAVREHAWWLAGNLGVPGMPEWTTYKCNCGWSGDEPHQHVAAAVVQALGEVFYKRGRYFFGEALNEDHPKLPFVKCLCGAEFTAERLPPATEEKS